ncbi:class I SAM-dependent methyltransferase [Aliamphritea spongicola]|nr:class I SAM-dependent methyltransferase [Aliamphritea spongicola]
MIGEHFGRLDVSVMDFGCGWCETLSYFKEEGMECYGIDTTPEAIEYGRSLGLNVEVSNLQDLNPFQRKFDVLLMQNVLEHLADPVAVVAEIHKNLLNPGGLFIIDVPNEFNEFQVAGKEVNNLEEWWVAPPAHLNYFSSDSLQALLQGKALLFLIKWLLFR